jgi:hypothetical protein
MTTAEPAAAILEAEGMEAAAKADVRSMALAQPHGLGEARGAGSLHEELSLFINGSNLHLDMADDFADIEIFVTVVEAGGFSAAARIVNKISISAKS